MHRPTEVERCAEAEPAQNPHYRGNKSQVGRSEGVFKTRREVQILVDPAQRAKPAVDVPNPIRTLLLAETAIWIESITGHLPRMHG